METDGSRACILSEIKTVLHEAAGPEVFFRIHDDLLSLIGAERVSLFACDQTTVELFTYMKTGKETAEIRIPADMNSIAGFCLSTRQTVNISDAYDRREISAFDKRMSFDKSWDEKSGFRTRQVLCVPVIFGGKYLLGVLQFLNCKEKYAFDEQDELLAEKVCESLALCMQKFVSAPPDRSEGPEDSIEEIIKVLRENRIKTPKGAAKAVEMLILENRNLKGRLKKFRDAFDGL